MIKVFMPWQMLFLALLSYMFLNVHLCAAGGAEA